MPRMRRALALAALFVAWAPVAAAQQPVQHCEERCAPTQPLVPSTADDPTVDIFLYAHMEHPLNDGLLTTQSPSPELDPPVDWGLLTPTLDTNTGTPLDADFGYDVRLVAATHIEVHDTGWSAYRHGTFRPLELGTMPLTLFVYYSADSDPQGQGPVGVAPQVRVAAVWKVHETDRDIVVAEGTSDSIHMMSQDGGRFAYEIPIELYPQFKSGFPDASLRRSSIEVRTYQVSNPLVEAGQAQIRVRSGVEFPWRLIVPVRNALDTAEVEWLRGDEGVFLIWHATSPFGVQDVDAESAVLRIPNGDGTMRELPPASVRYYNQHDFQLHPVRLVWKFSHAEAEEHLGKLGVLSVRNSQATFELRETVSFALQPLRPREVPAVDFAVALLIVALLGARLRHLKTQ